MLKILFIITVLFPTIALSAPTIDEVNYFASFRSNETNVRSGPGVSYPVKFTFTRKGLPVQVISEYDNWSEVKDFDGETGWVSSSLIVVNSGLPIPGYIHLETKSCLL